MNVKIATDTQKAHADLQTKAIAQQLIADDKAKIVVTSKKVMEEAIDTAKIAKKTFKVKEEAKIEVEKVAVKKQKIADDTLVIAKKTDIDAFNMQSTEQKLKAVEAAKVITKKAQTVATEAKKKAETKIAEKTTAVVYAADKTKEAETLKTVAATKAAT